MAAKRRRVRAVDRISKLPVRVLHSILSRLPLVEACRTTVLSRRWRRLFHSVPSLDIDGSFARGDGSTADESAWLDTVYGILDAHRGRIRCCAISVDFFEEYSEDFRDIVGSLCGWKNRVEELTLLNLWNDHYVVPRAVFCCRFLTRLELHRCRLAVPYDEELGGLGELRSLELEDIIMTDDDFAHVVSHCKRLESVVLEEVVKIKSIQVLSDSVSSLRVHTYRPLQFSLTGATRLRHVYIAFDFNLQDGYRTCHDFEYSETSYFDDLESRYDSEAEASNFMQLLRQLGNVESLNLLLDEEYMQCLCRESRRLPGSLPPELWLVNLKKLVVDMDLATEMGASILSCMFNSCPILQELAIRDDAHRSCWMLDDGYWELQNPEACVMHHLKAVWLYDVNLKTKHWLGLAKFLQLNARDLRKLTLFYTKDSGEQSSVVHQKLLSLPWASPNATLEVKSMGGRVFSFG